MPPPLSVAFQGGGARVVELAAAAHAVSDLVPHHAAIERVSGTSAGAIAAALFATGASFDSIVQERTELDKLVRTQFPRKRLNASSVIFRLSTGQAIYPEKNVRAVIARLFEIAGIDTSLSVSALMSSEKARCDQLRIVYSSLHESKPSAITEKSETPLLEALVHSLALPVIFRTPKSTTTPQFIDGGLFQNLPALAATDGINPGTIPVAFTFAERLSEKLERASLVTYAGYLISRSIEERTKESKLYFPSEFVIQLNSSRDTLHFDDMFGSSFGGAYSKCRSESKNELLQRLAKNPKRPDPDWHSEDLPALVDQYRWTAEKAAEFADKILAADGFHATLMRMEIVASSLAPGASNSPDLTRLIITLDGERNKGRQFFRIFDYDSDTGKLECPEIQVFVSQVGAENEDRPALVLTLPKVGVRSRAVLVVLDRPLEAGQTVRLVKTQRSFGLLDDFRNGKTYLQMIGMGPGRSADRMELAHIFPTEVTCRVRDIDTTVDAEALRRYDRGNPRYMTPTTTKWGDDPRPGWRVALTSVENIATCPDTQRLCVIYER